MHHARDLCETRAADCFAAQDLYYLITQMAARNEATGFAVQFGRVVVANGKQAVFLTASYCDKPLLSRNGNSEIGLYYSLRPSVFSNIPPRINVLDLVKMQGDNPHLSVYL